MSKLRIEKSSIPESSRLSADRHAASKRQGRQIQGQVAPTNSRPDAPQDGVDPAHASSLSITTGDAEKTTAIAKSTSEMPQLRLAFDPVGGIHAVPRFSEIKDEHLLPGIRQAIARANHAIDGVESVQEPTWDNLIGARLELEQELNEAASTLQLLMRARQSKVVSAAFSAVLPELVAVDQRLRGSRKVYRNLKKLRDGPQWSSLGAERQHVLDTLIRDAEARGTGLPRKTQLKLSAIEARIKEVGRAFNETSVAIRMGNNEGDNTGNISEILALRQQKAKLLGYPNYASLRMSQSAMGSLDAVRTDLESMQSWLLADKKDRTEPSPPMRVSESSSEDDEHTIKQARDPLWIRQHFTLDRALEFMFQFAGDMFGFTVQASENQTDVWHKNVRLYDIIDDTGALLGRYFLDASRRTGEKDPGSWSGAARRRHQPLGEGTAADAPLVYCSHDFPAPFQDAPVTLAVTDLKALYHEFGHVLQTCLNTSLAASASPDGGIETELVEAHPKFMEKWVMQASVLRAMSRSPESGEPMSQLAAETVVSDHISRLNRQNLLLVRRSLADLFLHSDFDPQRDGDPVAAYGAYMKEQGLPDWDEEARGLHTFSHIFSYSTEALYGGQYSTYVWSDVVAADAFSLFQEAGIDDPDSRRQQGQRFRKTLFAKCGARPGAELFAAFRGRQASPNALKQWWTTHG